MNDISKDYHSGMRVADIALKHGVSMRTIYNHIKHKRGKVDRNVGYKHIAYGMSLNGHSSRYIASQLGFHYTTIARWVRELHEGA